MTVGLKINIAVFALRAGFLMLQIFNGYKSLPSQHMPVFYIKVCVALETSSSCPQGIQTSLE